MSNKKQKAETTTEPDVVGNTVLANVPYQCCPLCKGNGQTVADGFTSSVYQTCKVCNGAMIIPMYIESLEKKETLENIKLKLTDAEKKALGL